MYSKYFKINKNFQSSVNLELDMDNESKIYEYVPTSDICDVIKKYVESALGRKVKNRATTLVGPYGKGKSFLLLILSYIFSKNKNTKCWNDLANKIKKVDEELYELLLEVKNRDINLMTVVINSNYDSLNQSFMIALTDALKKEHLENELTPKTAFSVASYILSEWESNPAKETDIFDLCVEKTGNTLEDIKIGLNLYSKKAYECFCEVYYCYTRGVRFNPFINDDIGKTFENVALQVDKYGYKGLFIVFDEFSKYIESTNFDVSAGLKIIQDLAEICTRSGQKEQLHLCCVAHKTLSLYKSDKKDTFKTVEGRFTEIRFNRSLEENYQIISSAILKKDGAEEFVKEKYAENEGFYKEIAGLEIFSNDEKLFKETYPLNPLTTFSLIQLSELVAQNERTLYTFLSDTDENSFNSFICNEDSGLFNVDKIYDYFSQLLQKEETNYIRNIWYRTESTLSKVENKNDRQVIKTLAIISMINDFDKLPPSVEIISLCCGYENTDKTESIINNLIEKKYLRRNLLNNLISFALSNTKHIDDKIAILKKTKFSNFDKAVYCNQINTKKYLIPRRHNEERKITRFYKVIYISFESFSRLGNFDYFFETNVCDGVVLNVLADLKDKDYIISKTKEFNNERVIVRFSSIKIENVLTEELLRYACLNEILKEGSVDEIAREEINLLLEETIDDTLSLLSKYFEENVAFYNSKYGDSDFVNMLSVIFDNYYSVPLRFNNELVNKHVLTTQYQKSVNNVVDHLLEKNSLDNLPFTQTSPEASLARTVLLNNLSDKSFVDLISKIKDAIIGIEGKKESFKKLFGFLQEPPYGIREGIIPLLFAMAISEISGNVLLYYDKRETVLDASNIVKAVLKDNYYLSYSKGSADQTIYLNKMMKLFNATKVSSFRINVVNLTNAIRRYFMGLPSIVRGHLSSSILNIDEKIVDLKNLYLGMNLNSYEVVFVKPKKILKTKNFNNIYKTFESLNDVFIEANKMYKQTLIFRLKTIFNINPKESLKGGISSFISSSIKEGEKPIFDNEDKAIYELVINNSNYDDYQLLNDLLRCTTGSYLEDWTDDNSDMFIEKINRFVNSIQVVKTISEKSNGIDDLIDPNYVPQELAENLSDNLEAVLDEYGESVPNSEKAKVLAWLLKKLL